MTQQRLPLAQQMKSLENIQELDLKIDQLKKSLSALPAGLKALEDSLLKARGAVEVKKNALGEVEKTKRQAQAAMDINRDRLTRSTSRLEEVRNSNEFQAVQKELEQLKKMATSIEEQIAKADSDAKTVTDEMQKLTGDMEKVQAERDAQASKLSGETEKFDAELATLTRERAKHSPNVDARTLAAYDRVRVARGGLGIVPAVAGQCKGCNMVVPPQLFNEIRKATVVHACPSCHRILFVPGEAPAPQA